MSPNIIDKYRYAYIAGRWRKCDCPYTEFAGCSERELQQLTEELRKRNRLHYGREHIEGTQKQLATFRRENADIETILRQQRHDRETRAALVVLEGGKKSSIQSSAEPPKAEGEKGKLEQETEKTKKIDPYKNLLVLRRIELGTRPTTRLKSRRESLNLFRLSYSHDLWERDRNILSGDASSHIRAS